MRIAHFESSMNWGGQELRIGEQTEWLNATGHSAWILARPGSALIGWASERNIPHQAIKVRGSAHPLTLVNLLKFLIVKRIDILDCHGSRACFYGSLVKILFPWVRVIHSRHITNQIKSSGFHGWMWRRGNHGIITTAEKIKAMLLDGGVDSEKNILVAPAGVDPVRFNPKIDGRSLRESLGIPKEHKVVANIGMIRPDKGQDVYVDACKRLLSTGSKITCIQVGEATTDTVAFKQKILQSLGDYADKIRFCGYQSNIEQYIAAVDVLVIASVKTEAQTRLVSQAFMMKKPVVATTVGGLPEMIDHRSTGILCPPRDSLALADAVTELLENESLRESICERAFSHAQENMTFSHMMVAMCAFYSEVLAK